MKKRLIFIVGVLLVLIFLKSTNAQVIFEDDFEYTWDSGATNNGLYPCTKDIGGSCTRGGLTNYAPSSYPAVERTNSNSWNGWRKTNGYGLAVNSGYGRNNGGGLKFVFPGGYTTGETGLLKYLGAQGYKELYIRWFLKFEDSGPEEWIWGDGVDCEPPNQLICWNFWKMFRMYAGVDLNSVRPQWDTTNNQRSNDFDIHPTSYPDEFIPQLQNSGVYATNQDVAPVIKYSAVYNQYVGSVSSPSLYNEYFKWYGLGGGIGTTGLTPDSTTDTYRFGPIITPAESTTDMGKFKYAQDWHSIEIHIKQREFLQGTQYSATYIDSLNFKVSGDQTGIFTTGSLWYTDTGQFNGYNNAMVKVVSSLYDGQDTTITIVDTGSGSANQRPFMNSDLTIVTALTESSPGIIEIYIDGVNSGPHQLDHSSINVGTDTAFPDLHGGFNYINFGDNIYGNKPHAAAVYIDDVVFSTEYIGPNYTIGSSCIPLRHPADTDCSDTIDITELMTYIDRWKNNEVGVTISTLFEALVIWKTG